MFVFVLNFVNYFLKIVKHLQVEEYYQVNNHTPFLINEVHQCAPGKHELVAV